MKRRDILCSLSAIALSGTMAPANAMMQADDSAAEIGRWLISHGLMPADRDVVSADLQSAWGAAATRKAVEADFGAGRVVSVEGWFISETEARLCALAAIDADRGVRV